MRELMPIINGKFLKAMPMNLLNEKQASINHGQTLERLATRGGLGSEEALAVIESRRPGNPNVGSELRLMSIIALNQCSN